jgi:ABC-type amino acid transport substrate-binding protein
MRQSTQELTVGSRQPTVRTRMSLRLAAALVVLAMPAPLRADLDAIKKAGELRVLVVDGAPVFVSLSHTGEPGLEREILDGFARLHGLHVRLVEVPAWKDLVPYLLEGKGDLIAGGVGDLPARRRLIDFTSEVFPSRDVVVTRKPTPVITTLEQLRAVKVGTIRGTGLADRIAEAKVPKANVDDEVPATGFGEALKSGRVKALVDGVEDALLLQRADPAVEMGMFLGPSHSLAFGVRKDCPALRDALSSYVTEMRRSALWSQLVVKYFGAAATEMLKRARGN